MINCYRPLWTPPGYEVGCQTFSIIPRRFFIAIGNDTSYSVRPAYWRGLNGLSVIMPYFQWWYADLALYEEKDGYRTNWRLARTRIRTHLTAQGAIKPKWKHELTLFHAVRQLYPDTLYQYRPEWLGNQSLDFYIPSLRTAIEYQGIQHYLPVTFFGGEDAFSHRQELDQRKSIYARKTTCV